MITLNDFMLPSLTQLAITHPRYYHLRKQDKFPLAGGMLELLEFLERGHVCSFDLFRILMNFQRSRLRIPNSAVLHGFLRFIGASPLTRKITPGKGATLINPEQQQLFPKFGRSILVNAGERPSSQTENQYGVIDGVCRSPKFKAINHGFGRRLAITTWLSLVRYHCHLVFASPSSTYIVIIGRLCTHHKSGFLDFWLDWSRYRCSCTVDVCNQSIGGKSIEFFRT